MTQAILGPDGSKRRRNLRWLLPLIGLATILSVTVFVRQGARHYP